MSHSTAMRVTRTTRHAVALFRPHVWTPAPGFSKREMRATPTPFRRLACGEVSTVLQGIPERAGCHKRTRNTWSSSWWGTKRWSTWTEMR